MLGALGSDGAVCARMRRMRPVLVALVAFFTAVCLLAAAGSARADDLTYTAISAGGDHTCALLETGSVVCWGYNEKGQLGTVGGADSLEPAYVPGLTQVGTVAAGENHNCAIRSAAQAPFTLCWGDNPFGQIGDGSKPAEGSTSTSSGVVSVSGGAVFSVITAGSGHSCGVTASGEALCWGGNTFGGLGTGSDSESLVPASVATLSAVESVAAGSAHTCALLDSGQVYCWGYNGEGQSGSGGTSEKEFVPLSVSGLSDATAIAAGGGHSCAIKDGGQVVCWGRNNRGQLGDNSTTNRSTPVLVEGLSDAVAIAAGGSHSCAIRDSGQVVCWGRNTFGELGSDQVGMGQGAMSRTPVEVTGITDVTAITTGTDHSCALKAGGEAYCWGKNDHGQLGDGSTDNRAVPTEVPPAPESQSFSLTVTRAGTGQGSVTSAPGGIDCGSTCSATFDGGTVVTLVATADADSDFSGFSGACSGTGTCTVTMDQARSVTANFTRKAVVPVPSGKAVLGSLILAPKAKKVKRGKSLTVTVKVKNTGDAAATAVKVCAKAPAALIKLTKSCLKAATIPAGKTVSLKFKLKVQKKAKKRKKATVSFTATASGLAKKTAKATITVG